MSSGGGYDGQPGPYGRPYGERPGPHGQPYGGPPGRPSPWPPSVPPMAPPLPPYPHAKPEPYHRILRTWSYRPWRPVVGLVMTVGLGVVVAPLLVITLVAIALAIFHPDGAGSFMSDLTELNVTPAVLLAVNLSLATLIPITFLVIRVLHGMRPRWLGSVRPGLRWGLLAQFVGIGLVATLIFSFLIGFVLQDSVMPSGSNGTDLPVSTTVAYLVIILLTSPLQSAAEEYAFRGYLLQAFGALVSNRWFTLLLTSLLFAIAHGAQNLPLFVDRFLFGLFAGMLVMYTGGLEAGIALHVVNNVIVLALAALSGALTETLNVSAATWNVLLVDIGQLLVYAGLVVLWSRRRGIRNVTAGPPPPA